MKKYSTASVWPERISSSPLYPRRASRADRNKTEQSKARPKRTRSLPHVRDHCRQVSRGYQRYKQEDVYETNRSIYWLGFFAADDRLQLHGSLGNTPMATECCNRFQKRCWQMGGTSDFKRPQSAKLRSGDSRH
jgi:hypothetical protein